MRRIIGTIGATLAIGLVMTASAAQASYSSGGSTDANLPTESISLNFAGIDR
jgi:hypothetical protein